MLKKYSYLSFFLATFALILGSIPLGAGSATTAKVIGLGSGGSDVQIIQTILNFDSATRLGTVGAGSPGRETDYFGEKTRSAVIKFQKKYQIKGENGQIGPQTRQLINYLGPQMLQAKKKKTSLIPTDWPEPGIPAVTTPVPQRYFTPKVTTKKTSAVVKKIVAPKLSSISPQTVGNGASLTLRGEGFTKTGNNIVTKFKKISNVSSSDGKTLSFAFSVPESEISASGVRGLLGQVGLTASVPISVFVNNSNGTSNELVFNYQI